MRALTFWKMVTMDRSNVLERLVELLTGNGIAFCVVGGQAVNAYAEPVVSLDLDLVVAANDLARLEALFGSEFRLERFPHSLNVSAPGSDVRVQVQTDPRYASFVARAEPREVLGLTLPVASAEDVLRGKVWAFQDPTRRPSKRQKDLADIARLVEVEPRLGELVPEEVRARLL